MDPKLCNPLLGEVRGEHALREVKEGEGAQRERREPAKLLSR